MKKHFFKNQRTEEKRAGGNNVWVVLSERAVSV